MVGPALQLSAMPSAGAAQLLLEPGPRELPFTEDRRLGYAQRLRGFGHAEAPEVAIDDDLRRAGVVSSELLERLVEGEHLVRSHRVPVELLVERDEERARPALHGAALASGVHQHPAHGARRDLHEMQ